MLSAICFNLGEVTILAIFNFLSVNAFTLVTTKILTFGSEGLTKQKLCKFGMLKMDI